jgi:hypothetical protein
MEWDKKEALNKQWGWLNKIWYDAEEISRALGVSYKLKQAARLVRYYEPRHRIHPALDIFFNYFMHDFSSEEHKFATLDAQSSTMLRTNNFFASRMIETLSSDDEPATDKQTANA